MAKYHEINIFRQTRSFMSRTASKDATDLKVVTDVNYTWCNHVFNAYCLEILAFVLNLLLPTHIFEHKFAGWWMKVKLE